MEVDPPAKVSYRALERIQPAGLESTERAEKRPLGEGLGWVRLPAHDRLVVSWFRFSLGREHRGARDLIAATFHAHTSDFTQIRCLRNPKRRRERQRGRCAMIRAGVQS